MSDIRYLRDFVRKHVKQNPGSKKSWNDITLPTKSNGAGWTHDTAKTTLAICYWLWTMGYDFMTEVYMLSDKSKKGTRRADIICPELAETQVIEIYDSESQVSINAKRAEYRARGITFIGVPAHPETAIKKLQQRNNITGGQTL